MSVALAVEQLSFAYPALASRPDAARVLNDVSFELRSGEWVVLLGATGSGKTTLCWALAGLAPQMTGGTLTGALRKADGMSIGLVFQDADAQLFNMTVEDEIAFGLETSGLTRAEMRARVRRWIDWARLSGLELRAPWQLSGGQKKRLALAAVLAMAPRLVILDDPTAGLDPVGAQEVTDVLNDLRREHDHTVFLATPQAELALQYADRALALDAGRIGLEGTPREVVAQRARLHQLGVGAPPMVELAHALNVRGRSFDFVTIDEAERALTNDAGGTKKTSQAPFVVRRSSHREPAALAFLDLWFQYPDAEFVLRGVDLAIARGSFVALMGANGSGKTTLAKHANGLLRPTRGRVLLDGRDIAREPTAQLAKRVGYVFQNPDHQLFAASVREELAFGLRNIGLSADAIQQCVSRTLDEFGLRAVADQPPAILNYGARRLVTLAAVWAMQPTLWILDEPTTGLDARHAELVMQHVRRAQQDGATILLISHDVERVAACAERVLIMSEGRVMGDGTPREIFADRQQLQAARLTAPPVTMLAQRLQWPVMPLSVAEFVEAYLPA